MATINERRMAALAELDEAGRSLEVRDSSVPTCPLAPSFGDTEGERWYLRFLARAAGDPERRRPTGFLAAPVHHRARRGPAPTRRRSSTCRHRSARAARRHGHAARAHLATLEAGEHDADVLPCSPPT
jgi:hypothetical protein